MDVRPWPLRAASQDLSKAESFVLGQLTVDPPTRQIGNGAHNELLEPRVMRVLVALASAKGKVLSRDDLIELCWDGQIVGDNAINRVISRLRRVLGELGGGLIRLETITKVGFRLVSAGSESLAPPAPSPAARSSGPDEVVLNGAPRQGTSRRRLLVVGVVAAAVAGGLTAFRYRGHVPDPRAVRLARKADDLMKSGLPGATRQATRYLQQAVDIDPDYAAGWGQLACMYHHSFEGFSAGERQSYPQLLNSAAERALALDPDQPDAQLALVVLRPYLGRWRQAEADLRAIQKRHPDHWYANAQLNLLLMDVGRFEEALPYRRNVIAIDPAIPVAWAFLAMNELLANRIHEADATLDRAMATWPSHSTLWFTRYSILLQTGRPAEAASFVRDVRYQPDGLPTSVIAKATLIAEAIGSTDPAMRKRVAQSVVSSMEISNQAPDGAPVLALLGEGDLALSACVAHFLGGTFVGRQWPPPTRFDGRMTSLLFHPSILALQGRPAYRDILRHTGLEYYWARSGSQPDFRRS